MPSKLRPLVFVCLLAAWGVGLAAPQTSSLTLREAIELALVAHPDVQEAELGLESARLELRAARAKASLPSINFQLSPLSLSSQTGFPGIAKGTLALGLSLPTGTDLSLDLSPSLDWSNRTLSLSWGVSLAHRYDPAQPEPEVRMREEKVEAAEAALAQARDAVVLEVVGEFAGVLSAQRAVAQAEGTLLRAQDHLEKVEADLAAGLAGELDRLDAELNLREAEVALRKRQSELAGAREDFQGMLGLEGYYELVPPELALGELCSRAEGLLAQGVPEEAISKSAAVRAAEENLRAAEENLRAAQAIGKPAPAVSFRWGNEGWQFGISLGFSLFSPGRAEGIELAQAELSLAQANLQAAQAEARRAIDRAAATLREDRENLEILELEREKLALEDRVTEMKLEADVIGWAEWEEFLVRKEGFQGEWEQAAFEFALAYLGYRDALGLPLSWEEIVP